MIMLRVRKNIVLNGISFFWVGMHYLAFNPFYQRSSFSSHFYFGNTMSKYDYTTTKRKDEKGKLQTAKRQVESNESFFYTNSVRKILVQNVYHYSFSSLSLSFVENLTIQGMLIQHSVIQSRFHHFMPDALTPLMSHNSELSAND